MRYDVADIDEEKEDVIRQAVTEFDLDVRIVGNGYSRGILERALAVLARRAEAFAVLVPFMPDGLVVIHASFVDKLTPEQVEHVVLHEAGHHEFERLSHEEFAEKFAMKYFSGTDEEFQRSCATIWHDMKTSGDSLVARSVGDDIV